MMTEAADAGVDRGFGLANMDWRCVLFIVKCLESYCVPSWPNKLNGS